MNSIYKSVTSVSNTVFFILFTICLIFISRYVMALTHEYSHSVLAWLLNAKSLPFDIYYGDWTLLNVDEAVDYRSLYDNGRTWTLAAIALMPTFINAIIYVICLCILLSAKKLNRWLYAGIFWFGMLNLSEIFAYIPIRTFGTHGDMHNLQFALNISPWWIYLPGSLLVGGAIWHFFHHPIFISFNRMQLTVWQRLFYLFFVIFVLFFVFGSVGFSSYGDVSHVFSGTSMAFAPVLFVLLGRFHLMRLRRQ